MVGIYCITNLANGKKYIGQARDIEQRWKEHIWQLNANRHHNRHLQSSWNKYGKDNFIFEIICLCNQEELNELEIYYIDKFDTYYKNNLGYNLTLGGEGTTGHTLSEETKKVIGDAQRGKEISDEHRKALSNQFKNDGNPFYGKRHTDGTKKLISQIRIEQGISKGGNNIKAKKVICDNIIFECAQYCADYYKINSATLRSWLRGDRPMPIKFKQLGLSYI